MEIARRTPFEGMPVIHTPKVFGIPTGEEFRVAERKLENGDIAYAMFNLSEDEKTWELKYKIEPQGVLVL